MGQKLAKGTGLSLRQEQFLALVLQEKYILENFYLTGGTALSNWYLHHRESYDLDFFSDKTFDSDRIIKLFKRRQDQLGARAITFDEDFGFLTLFLRYPDNGRLKTDFNHYSDFRLKEGFKWQGLQVDSLYDIAVNKTQTIRTHPRERDYADLYFIIKETGWRIDNLLSDADKKFSMTTDSIQTAKNFLKVSEVSNLPKMLVPFDQKDMEKFFLDLAKSLKSQIFKK